MITKMKGDEKGGWRGVREEGGGGFRRCYGRVAKARGSPGTCASVRGRGIYITLFISIHFHFRLAATSTMDVDVDVTDRKHVVILTSYWVMSLSRGGF